MKSYVLASPGSLLRCNTFIEALATPDHFFESSHRLGWSVHPGELCFCLAHLSIVNDIRWVLVLTPQGRLGWFRLRNFGAVWP